MKDGWTTKVIQLIHHIISFFYPVWIMFKVSERWRLLLLRCRTFVFVSSFSGLALDDVTWTEAQRGPWLIYPLSDQLKMAVNPRSNKWSLHPSSSIRGELGSAPGPSLGALTPIGVPASRGQSKITFSFIRNQAEKQTVNNSCLPAMAPIQISGERNHPLALQIGWIGWVLLLQNILEFSLLRPVPLYCNTPGLLPTIDS